MIKVRFGKSAKDWLMILVFYLLILQNVLQGILPAFGYIDELFALAGVAIILVSGLQKGKITLKKSTVSLFPFFLIFLAVGLLGNILFRYQPITAVATDVFTNMKFFLAIISGYVLFSLCNCEKDHNVLLAHTKLVAIVYFVMLMADQLFHVFTSGEMRYGLRVSQFMYSHPTALAAAEIFLLSILTVFYKKKNNLYILLCLCVLFFTLRGKAIAGTAMYCLIFYFVIIYKQKLKIRHILIIAAVALLVAGEQIVYYYIDLEDESARSALTKTAFQIMGDYFPIGTGFGTFASHTAAEYYSPVYFKYGLYNVHGLSQNNTSFGSDTFWPIILGQTGAIGTVCYVVVIVRLALRILKIRKTDIPAYAAGIFIFAYLMVSSTSESAFCNPASIPLAMMLGYIFTLEKHLQKEESK